MSLKKIFHDSDSDEYVAHSLFGKAECSTADDKDSSSDEEDERLLADSDSDSAPEDVGFVESRLTALDRVKDALSSIHREKTSQKTKRRERAHQFEAQKKRKLEKLAGSRLPEDFLTQLSEISEKQRDQEPDKKKKKSTQEPVPEIEPQERIINEQETEGSACDSEEENMDFIPLKSGSGIKAVVLKEEMKKSLSSAQRAADFQQKRLYGSTVPRETVKSKLSKSTKRRARFLKQ